MSIFTTMNAPICFSSIFLMIFYPNEDLYSSPFFPHLLAIESFWFYNIIPLGFWDKDFWTFHWNGLAPKLFFLNFKYSLLHNLFSFISDFLPEFHPNISQNPWNTGELGSWTFYCFTFHLYFPCLAIMSPYLHAKIHLVPNFITKMILYLEYMTFSCK